MLRALTDGLGHAYYSNGKMVVVLAPDPPSAASFIATGSFSAVATVVLGSQVFASFLARGAFGADATVHLSTTPRESGLGKYVPLNAFQKRTIVRKRR